MDITTLYSEQAEKSILGACLFHQYLTVKRLINSSDLYLDRHKIIFNACQNVFSQYGKVDITLVGDALKASGNLDEIGGVAYLMQLMNALETTKYTEVYCHLVKRVASRRKVYEFGQTLDDRLANTEQPINEIITDMLHDLKRLQAPDIDDHVIDFADSLSATYDIIAQNVQLHEANRNYTLGVQTGLTLVDHVLDGLRYGDVNVLAGYTGAGKSACVFTIALNAAQKGINRETQRPAKVLIFSGEMTQFAMNNRMLSMESSIDVHTIERGAFTQAEYSRYVSALSKLSNLPIRFKRTTRLNVDDLSVLVEQEIERNGLDLLILDGILQLDTGARHDQDWLRINAIMEMLEHVAITYNMTILATHQINRTGAYQKPTLADLKRSSAVEEKAARVLLLWKPDDAQPNLREIVIAKNRHGETGSVPIYFNTETTKFYNLEKSIHRDI